MLPAYAFMGGDAGISFSITSNITDFVLRNYLISTFGWDGSAPIDVVVTVENSIVIGSTSNNNAAFTTGAFPAGSRLLLINFGLIVGAGGNAGIGAPSGQRNGSNGGHAITLNYPIIIDNTDGLIWAGGGGGGAGGFHTNEWNCDKDACDQEGIGGGGGGGGAGYSSAGGSGGNPAVIGAGAFTPIIVGNAGQNGGISGPGSGGAAKASTVGGLSGCAGGNGGNFGQAGSNGQTSPHTRADGWHGGGAGGQPGKAINLNGQPAPTWLGGSGSPNVIGAVS